MLQGSLLPQSTLFPALSLFLYPLYPFIYPFRSFRGNHHLRVPVTNITSVISFPSVPPSLVTFTFILPLLLFPHFNRNFFLTVVGCFDFLSKWPRIRYKFNYHVLLILIIMFQLVINVRFFFHVLLLKNIDIKADVQNNSIFFF